MREQTGFSPESTPTEAKRGTKYKIMWLQERGRGEREKGEVDMRKRKRGQNKDMREKRKERGLGEVERDMKEGWRKN